MYTMVSCVAWEHTRPAPLAHWKGMSESCIEKKCPGIDDLSPLVLLKPPRLWYHDSIPTSLGTTSPWRLVTPRRNLFFFPHQYSTKVLTVVGLMSTSSFRLSVLSSLISHFWQSGFPLMYIYSLEQHLETRKCVKCPVN